MLNSRDKMWGVQQPGTILRSRWGNENYGKLALVLARAYDGRAKQRLPPRRYVKMRWITSGSDLKMLVNAHNCFDIVSSCDTLTTEEN